MKGLRKRTTENNMEVVSGNIRAIFRLSSFRILYKLKKHPLCRKQFTERKRGWGTRERDMYVFV